VFHIFNEYNTKNRRLTELILEILDIYIRIYKKFRSLEQLELKLEMEKGFQIEFRRLC
jgi:hypothetical protein